MVRNTKCIKKLDFSISSEDFYNATVKLGNYELISNDNRKASFEITDTGKLVGKIKENINESKPVIVSAIAELIITIQTGTTYINYILIIIILLSIITSLYLVQKKTNKKYLS